MGNVRRGLIISLGGSIGPVVDMINKCVDDETYVFFLTSDTGDKDTSTKFWVTDEIPQRYRKGFEGRNIIEITEGRVVEGRYEVISADPDELNDLYKVLNDAYLRLKSMGVDEILANFTGGTKVMSSAMVLLSIVYDDIKLYFNRGIRSNVEKETVTRVLQMNTEEVMFELLKKKVNMFYERFQYDSALMEIDSFIKKYESHRRIGELLRYHRITLAFSLWDKFEFKSAYEHLESVSYGEFGEHLKILDKLRNCDPVKWGYKLCELVNNAKRRMVMGEYDNAVARLYRALECLAQTILYKVYSIKTDEIIAKLDILREEGVSAEDIAYYRTKQRGIGLVDTYELLSKMERTKDNVGAIYLHYKDEIRKILNERNNSILAHGFKSVTKEQCEKFLNFYERFWEEVVRSLPKEGRFEFDSIELPQRLF